MTDPTTPTGKSETTPFKPLTIIARSNGHEWVDPTENGSKIPGVFCRKCMMMQRRDGKNGKCTGHARLRL